MRYPRIIVQRAAAHGFILIAAIHLVAAISFVHLLDSRPLWAVGGLLLVGLALMASLRAMRRTACHEIELGDDGCLRFPDRPGVDGRPCGRMADFGVMRWLEWHESPVGHRRALMLWRAACTPEDWRALGIWLRHKAAHAARDLSDAA